MFNTWQTLKIVLLRSGFIYFLVSIIELGIIADPDPSDVYVFRPPGSGSGSISQRYGSGSFYHQAKLVRKTLIPTVLGLLFNFLSLKNDVNVP
jgi:hypothetical protein